ncbi:MAG: hypothetical protein JWP81_5148 [Ferruginibacter sp.]|nr:hypothetical protein [Ferruginibacter sp.]
MQYKHLINLFKDETSILKKIQLSGSLHCEYKVYILINKVMGFPSEFQVAFLYSFLITVNQSNYKSNGNCQSFAQRNKSYLRKLFHNVKFTCGDFRRSLLSVCESTK